eukprot:888162-Prymnesium_polylepis.1
MAALYQIMRPLRKRQGFVEVKCVPARVPILTCKDSASGLSVDISINSDHAHSDSAWMCERCAPYPLLRPLVLVIKCLLQQHDLRATWTGGIGSYL